MNLPERNHNPFSLLQLKPSKWRGLVGSETNGFLKFDNVVHGIRAGFINLIQKINRGDDTIDEIFQNYGDPGHEETYKAMVEKVSGIQRHTLISTPYQLGLVGRGIVVMENGSFWLNPDDFQKGLELALESYPLKPQKEV